MLQTDLDISKMELKSFLTLPSLILRLPVSGVSKYNTNNHIISYDDCQSEEDHLDSPSKSNGLLDAI